MNRTSVVPELHVGAIEPGRDPRGPEFLGARGFQLEALQGAESRHRDVSRLLCACSC